MDVVLTHIYWAMLIPMIESICYISVFAFSFRKRTHFIIRTLAYILGIIIFLGFTGVAIFFLFKNTSQFDKIPFEWIQIVLNTISVIWVAFILNVCYQEQFVCLVYAIVAGKSANIVSSSIYNIFLSKTGKYAIYVTFLDRADRYSVIFYFLIHALMLTACYLLFAREFAHVNKIFNKTLSIYVLIIFSVSVCIAIFFQGNVAIKANDNKEAYILFNFMFLIWGLTILIIEKFILYWLIDWQEKEVIKNYYDNYKNQTSMLQKNMELVNVKCHDLKHQIYHMLDNQNLNTQFLEEIQQAISIYDTNIQTGNKNLDIILTEKSLNCEINHIQLTSMLDGTMLNFMTISDINSLFGNSLDNAIEYLLGVEEFENRFIRISSWKKFDIFTIRIENYCKVKINFDKFGFPITTKADKENHGFGVRSMKIIVEKYGGTINYKNENNLFVITALFMLKNAN